jgi:hypothetical protein
MNAITFQLPVLMLEKVTPVLTKGDIIFASQMVFSMDNQKTVTAYENKGLELTSLLGQKVEVLLEITRGEVVYLNDGEVSDQKYFGFDYCWLRRPLEYIDVLISLGKDLISPDKDDEEPDNNDLEDQATSVMRDWGRNGLNIGLYQAKPVLNSSRGLFLLNEFEFEEDIDSFEFGQQVSVVIEECFLRGIRPYVSEQERQLQKIGSIYHIYEGKEYTKDEWRQYLINRDQQ